VRAGTAFLAGLVLGAAGAWLVTTRVAPLSPNATPASMAAAPGAAPSPSPSTPAPAAGPLGPTATFPGPSTLPAAPLGVPEAPASTPPSAPAPTGWRMPEPEVPLGTRTPPPVLGDSTDGQLTPRALAPPADAASVASVSDLERLRSRQLLLPVQGFDRHQLRDDFAEKRGTRVHEAIDMAAPRGTPVLAVDDGVVKKLFTSAAGGFTVYEFDPDGTYSYYYAHLDRYAEGLHEGQAVRKGDQLGYVGTSGNAPASTPHLHFTIFKLAPGKRWWEGTPINPYPLWAFRR
jgi:murein DD-endopeptidase MepM/ murein hydrolase activator NlpD